MREVFLVTGGSGFIGSEAVRELILKGFKVYNIDKLTYACLLYTSPSPRDRG